MSEQKIIRVSASTVLTSTGQPGKIAAYLAYLNLSYDAVEWIFDAPPLTIRGLGFPELIEVNDDPAYPLST